MGEHRRKGRRQTRLQHGSQRPGRRRRSRPVRRSQPLAGGVRQDPGLERALGRKTMEVEMSAAQEIVKKPSLRREF
jgi:hypothetical protein